MTLQYSVAVRNAQLDAFETAAGASALLRIYDLTAGAPADCAAAITATLLAEMALPSDWMAAAGSGSKAKNGTWQDPSANGTGTADFFRVYDSAGTTCHAQGTIPGDMSIDNASIAAGQVVNCTGFTLTAGNA